MLRWLAGFPRKPKPNVLTKNKTNRKEHINYRNVIDEYTEYNKQVKHAWLKSMYNI